jgi:predicted MFS family arabinose efflux permease
MDSAKVWKNPDFLLFIGGQTISQLGSAISTFAIPWLLLQLTGSGAETGIAFAIGFVPYLLVSLPAGVWADRWNRKALMMCADAMRLLFIVSIPICHALSGHTPLALLYVVQAGISLFSGIFDASYGSCVPNLVTRSQIKAANSGLQAASSLSRITGPVIAGALVTVLGPANILLGDASSFLVSILTLVLIRSPFQSASTSGHPTKLLADVREGLHYVWQQKTIRTLALFSMLVNLVGPGMDVALIYRLQHEIHLASGWAGVVMTGLGCGMFMGSFTLAWLNRRLTTGVLLITATALQVIPPFILAVLRAPLLMVLVQFVIGILLVIWNVQTVTLRQLLVPDWILGRCVSVFRMIAWISIPLGDATAGVVSQAFGSSVYFVVAGAVIAVVSVICARSKGIMQVNEGDAISQPMWQE